jgi:hypothetical protein
VVVARAVPPFVGTFLAGAGGISISINAPPHEITIQAAIGAQFGTAIGALATLSLVTFVAFNATHAWRRVGVRIAGSWIAASAILVLALRLAR